MAVALLSQRLFGMAAVCVLAVMAPISLTQRIAALTAFAIGVCVAAVLPSYDRLAVRAVGPSIIVLCLVPIGGPWSLAHLVASVALGFAGFNRTAMNRLVPALGLPLMLAALRTGTDVPWGWAALWAALVTASMLLVGRVGLIESGTRLSSFTDRIEAGPDFSLRRRVHALLALTVVVPAAIARLGPSRSAVGRSVDPR